MASVAVPPRLQPLLQLTRARLLEVWREPGILFWIFGFPALMAVLLGLAFRSQPVTAVAVGVLENGAASRWVLEALGEHPGIDARLLAAADARQALRLGRVDVVVEAAASASDGGRAPPARFSYRFDPTRPQSRGARLLLDDALQRAAGRGDVAITEEERLSEPGSRYIDFLIPGLIGMNLMGSSLWGIGFALVDMRLRKVLKRFAATPMRRSDFMMALMLSRLVFLVFEVAFLITFGWLVFGVVVRGSLVELILLSLVGSLSFTGVGLLLAARPKSIEVASGWMNAIMLPMWICSGSFFSYAGFPEILHPLIRALPLTALNDALRRVMNEGAPLLLSWSELLVLLVWGGVSFAIALRIFRWQ